jgi:hypothetical protein
VGEKGSFVTVRFNDKRKIAMRKRIFVWRCVVGGGKKQKVRASKVSAGSKRESTHPRAENKLSRPVSLSTSQPPSQGLLAASLHRHKLLRNNSK